MQDPQPQLPFGDDWNLQQIRKLLEVQNELLRELLDRLSPSVDVRRIVSIFETGPAAHAEEVDDEDGYDPFEELEGIPDDDEDEFDDSDETESGLSEPPTWFARYFWDGL